jgi:hypothetical protein
MHSLSSRSHGSSNSTCKGSAEFSSAMPGNLVMDKSNKHRRGRRDANGASCRNARSEGFILWGASFQLRIEVMHSLSSRSHGSSNSTCKGSAEFSSAMPVPKVLSCGEHPYAPFNRFFSILMTRLPGIALENLRNGHSGSSPHLHRGGLFYACSTCPL